MLLGRRCAMVKLQMFSKPTATSRCCQQVLIPHTLAIIDRKPHLLMSKVNTAQIEVGISMIQLIAQSKLNRRNNWHNWLQPRRRFGHLGTNRSPGWCLDFGSVYIGQRLPKVGQVWVPMAGG